MRITRSDNRRLVMVDFPWFLGLVFFPTAALMLVVTVVAIAKGLSASQITGPLISGLLSFAVAAAFTKRCEFDFDLVAKKLTWRHRGLFTNAGGVVPFEQIRSAAVESSSDNDGGLTYRVILRTRDGTIPLTESYNGNRDIVDRFRSAIVAALQLNLHANAQIETDILELARAGRKIDAIALRERYGYDLAAAKAFVEQLTT